MQFRYADRVLVGRGSVCGGEGPPKADVAAIIKEVREGPWHKVAARQPAARGQEPRGRQPVEWIVVALESPILRIEVLPTLTQNGAPHERDQHCQSAASAYDQDMAARKLNPPSSLVIPRA